MENPSDTATLASIDQNDRTTFYTQQQRIRLKILMFQTNFEIHEIYKKLNEINLK